MRRPARSRPTAAGVVRVVILTTCELDGYVFEALRAGASGFLVKDTEPVDLLAAVRLFLSPLTVKTHVSRAMVKLHARDRAQLVVRASQSGLVKPR